MKWQDLEGGGKIAILHVEPRTQATDLVIRAPKNAHVPRHWHSANETITILSGTFVLGHDGSGDPVELNAGSYAYMPAKMIHQAWIKGDADAQYFITIDGPWDTNWVEGSMKAAQ